MMTTADIKTLVKSFILSEFLKGESEGNLTDDVRLISDGIIDSMASLRLVSYLEESFGVSIKTNQVNAEHLDTLDLIVKTVMENKPQRRESR